MKSDNDNIFEKGYSQGITGDDDNSVSDFSVIVDKNNKRVRQTKSSKTTPRKGPKRKSQECGAASQCGLLREPELGNNSNLWSLEQEYKVLRDEDLLTKPLEIYLNYCQRFARQNLNHIKIKVQPYKFSILDFDHKKINPRIFQEIQRGLQEEQEQNQQSYPTNIYDEISSHFETVGIKIFTEIIFIDNVQILVVKTWQHVRYSTMSKKKREFEIKIRKKAARAKSQSMNQSFTPIPPPSDAKSKSGASQSEIKLEEDDEEQVLQDNDANIPVGFEDINGGSFYIKTIQFHYQYEGGAQGLQQHGPVLVEYVEGRFAENKMHDTSILHHKNKIYFFQRQFQPLDNKQEQRYQDSPSKMSLRSNRNQTQEIEQDSQSELQLQCLELIADDQYLLNQINGHSFQEVDDFGNPIFLTTNFSYEFGQFQFSRKGEVTENDFLNEQFVVLQQYATDFQDFPVQIYSFKKKEIIVRSQQNEQIDLVNQQVILCNHIKNYDQHEQGITHFMIQNQTSMIQIKFDEKNGQCGFRWYQRNSSHHFQKIWNTNGIEVLSEQLSVHDELLDTYKTVEQYYFIDSRNQVQILFPNYCTKIDKTKINELILAQANLTELNYYESKKINLVVPDSIKKEYRRKNICQRINDLQRILNYEKINQSHQLTFCRDIHSQIFYVIQPKSSVIVMMHMREQHSCEICHHHQGVQDEMIMAMKSHQLLASIQGYTVNQMLYTNSQANSCQPKLAKPKIGRSASSQNLVSTDRQSTNQGICQICDEDHQQEYAQFMIPPNKRPPQNLDEFGGINEGIVDRDGNLQWSLKPDKKINHVVINDQLRGRVVIKLYDTDSIKSKQWQLRLVWFQPTKNQSTFVFSIFNFDDKFDQQNTDRSNPMLKKSYIFVTKNQDKMADILNNKANYAVIDPDEDVYLLKSYRTLQKIPFRDIKEFQFKTQDLDNMSDDSFGDDDEIKEEFYKDIKLTFCQVKDNQRTINFIPFIYQEKTIENNKFIVFDIKQNQLGQDVSVNPPVKSLKYIYEDEQGYNYFALCRTSDIIDGDDRDKKGSQSAQTKASSGIQRARYQLFTLYSEKVGIIHSNEFLVTSDQQEGTFIQPFAQKQILLSRKSLLTYDWQFFKNMSALPFLDSSCSSIKGCQLVLHLSRQVVDSQNQVQRREEYTCINLLDQDKSNVYSHKSQVVLVGQKMFQLDQDDSELYALVISSMIRANLVEKNLFDSYEVNQLLSKAIDFQMGMRIPDLEYIALNSFEDLQTKNLFQSQEILQGKSICEISLSDCEVVEHGLQKYIDISKEGSSWDSGGSIFELLMKNDQLRKDNFTEIGFAPSVLIIKKDLNFTGTIERALKFKAYKSAKMILHTIFEDINTQEYQPYIMNDLPVILDSKQVEVNQFFTISESERSEIQKKGFCNLEINFRNVELPVFSDQLQEYIVQNDFADNTELEQELTKSIILRDKQKPENKPKIHEIEHQYIDFREVILGEKVRNISILKKKNNWKFNDVYYANWMIKCGTSNPNFYLQKSAQKIIDYQYVKTRAVMTKLFFMYVFFFLIPICCSLLSDEEWVEEILCQIGIVPAIILFSIELVQMRQQGIKYFMGWNLVDFSLFSIFLTFEYIRFLGLEHKVTSRSEIKLFLVIIAFLKLMFFVRIFEEYGFLVQMICLCIKDLCPFIVSYLVFLYVFSVCFVVLKMELDPIVDEVEGLTFFQKMLLQTFRTALGELAMPEYSEILAKEDSLFRTINIFLIWVCWFSQTLFMLVIMLNFLIAVISSTYERVINYQIIISYMHKADLNQENYNLMSFLVNLPEYRVIVFSSSMDLENMEDDQLCEVCELIKKFVSEENKEVKCNHDVLLQYIEEAKFGQEQINEVLINKFQKLEELQTKVKKEIISELSSETNPA